MSNTISIIPYPYCVEEKNGSLNLKKDSVFVLQSVDLLESAGIKFSTVAALFERSGFCFAKGTDSKENAVSVLLEKSDCYKNHSLTDEAYCLEISSEQILIVAISAAGFLYGFVSLCQLLMANELECVCIYDKPAYKWRGFMLDTCRSFFSVAFIKKMLESSAFHKFNVFHWHLTDDQGWRLPVPEYPRLVEIGSQRQAHTMPESVDGLYDEGQISRRYYTEEEITEIVNYASDLQIQIVPEVEFPGHGSALLAAYPEFGCTGGPYQVEHRWGIFPDVVCMGNDKMFDVYDKTFAVIERLFPGKYLHIGGDECLTIRWEKCPKCQQRMKDQKLMNMSQLQSWGTSKIAKMVLAHNKIPIGWDEVLDNTELFPLSEDVIVQSWRGVEGGERASAMNHKVIMSPQTHCYMNLKNMDSFEEPGRLGVTTAEKAYSYNPVTENMSEKSAAYVLGGECTFWSEAIRSSRIAEYLMFPRFCAMAECMWTDSEKKDFDRFEKNVEVHKNRLDKMDFLYFKGSLRG